MCRTDTGAAGGPSLGNNFTGPATMYVSFPFTVLYGTVTAELAGLNLDMHSTSTQKHTLSRIVGYLHMSTQVSQTESKLTLKETYILVAAMVSRCVIVYAFGREICHVHGPT